MIATTQTSQFYTFTPGASPSTYNIPFCYRQQAEIFAIMSQTGLPNLQLTQGVDFSLTLPSPTGGTLTQMRTWDVRYGNLTIFRSTPHVNEESVVDGGGIVADRLEFMIDELTQMIQEIGNGNIPTSGYALTFPTSDPPGLSYVLPVVAARALQQLTFDASGAPSVTASAGAAINAVWQAGLAQAQTIALQISFGLIPAGSTIDKMQFDMENRHRLGEYVWTDDYVAPSQYDPANPQNQWAGLYLENGDQTITTAHWPLGVPHLLSIPIAYQRGQGTEVTAFGCSGWSITSNVVTITFNATTANDAILAALAEELLVHGNTYTGWRTVTVPLLGASVPAGDYAITNLNAGARTLTFSYTVANNSGGAFNANFYAYRISGSATSALVYKAQGRTLMSTGDLDEETPYAAQNKNIIGLRRRSWGQGHLHRPAADSSVGGAVAGFTYNSASQGTANLATGSPITDGTNGTPRAGKSTEAKSMGAALSLWMGRYVA